MDTCRRIFTLMTPFLGRITTGTYLLSDSRQGYFGTCIGHHLQSMPQQRPSYNCVHIHLQLLSLISKIWVPNRRKGYTIMLKKSSNPAQGIMRWLGTTILLFMRHWLVEPLDQISNPIETEPTSLQRGILGIPPTCPNAGDCNHLSLPGSCFP
jgi:hypothetical protein